MNRLSIVTLAAVVAITTFGCAVPADAARGPVISSISPSSVIAGGSGFTLTVNGLWFNGNSSVLWNGSPRPTVTISGTQLLAFVSSADISTVGTVQIYVVDPKPTPQQSNSTSLTINPPPLTITTSSLPTAIVQLPYSAGVTNSGGIAPYTWRIASGQLPPGLTLNSTNGAINGVPGQTGKYAFTTQVTDSSPTPQTASQPLAVSVTAPAPLLISTTTLPNGTVQVPYSSTLTATGGMTPYSWSVVSGALPPGLALSASSGAVTGTPSTSGQDSFTVQVKDSAAQTAIQVFTVSIAATTLQLSASPTSLSFGNVTVGSSSTQAVLLTNTGNSSVSISQINVSGAGFSTSGLTPPMTLAAGQSTAFSVVYAPTSSGSVTGSVSVISNATNSPATIALSGSGVQPVSHSVTLSWSPSTSVVVGYNVYRGTQSGGPYTKLTSSPIPTSTYTDSTVQAGQTYFYVVTAVDSNNVESPPSNQVSATIPTP